MTVVIGYIENNQVYMGADSMFSNYYTKFSQHGKKIISKPEMLIGVCGGPRLNNIIAYDFTVEQKPDNWTDEQFIYQTVNMLREKLSEVGYIDNKDDVNHISDNTLLIGYNGKLYHVDSDFSIECWDGKISIIGSGCYTALGAIEALDKYTKCGPKEKVMRALRITADVVPSVGGPFQLEVL